MTRPVVAVVLEPDVASVFEWSAEVKRAAALSHLETCTEKCRRYARADAGAKRFDGSPSTLAAFHMDRFRCWMY